MKEARLAFALVARRTRFALLLDLLSFCLLGAVLATLTITNSRVALDGLIFQATSDYSGISEMGTRPFGDSLGAEYVPALGVAPVVNGQTQYLSKGFQRLDGVVANNAARLSRVLPVTREEQSLAGRGALLDVATANRLHVKVGGLFAVLYYGGQPTVRLRSFHIRVAGVLRPYASPFDSGSTGLVVVPRQELERREVTDQLSIPQQRRYIRFGRSNGAHEASYEARGSMEGRFVSQLFAPTRVGGFIFVYAVGLLLWTAIILRAGVHVWTESGEGLRKLTAVGARASRTAAGAAGLPASVLACGLVVAWFLSRSWSVALSSSETLPQPLVVSLSLVPLAIIDVITTMIVMRILRSRLERA